MNNLLLALLFSSASYALEYETTVTEKVFDSSSKVIITQDDIKKSGVETVTQLLNSQASINFANTSRGFKSNEIFLRGGDSGHVLIILDGVPVYDSTTAQRTMDLNFINLKSIKQIQVIKGSQTVLYGGQALSGVIKIDTFAKDIKSVTSANLDFGSSSFSKLHAARNINLSNTSSFFVSAQTQSRRNQSSVENSSVVYPSEQMQAELGYANKDFFNYYLRTKYIDDSTQMPTTAPSTQKPMDTEEFFQKSRHLHSSLVFELPNLRNTQLVFGHQQSQRLFEQESSATKRDYKSQSLHVRIDSDLYRSEKLQVFIGFGGNKEFLDSELSDIKFDDNEQNLYGVYLKVDYAPTSNLQFFAGVRNDWLAYKEFATYQLGFTLFENTRVEYSTGVRSPSLFQKFGFPYGNIDLKPESSSTFALTQDFKFDAGVYSVGLFETYFNNHIGIFTDASVPPPGKYSNIAKSRIKGIENSVDFSASDTVTLSASHTYQEAWDIARATWMEKRALQSGSFRATYALGKDITTIQLVGQSERTDFGSKLPGYMTLNAFHSYQLTPTFLYSIKFFNLTNKKVQESVGYFGEGTNVVFGLEYFN